MDIQDRLKQFPAQQDHLLNILHDLQKHHSKQYIPQESIKAVAAYLNITMSTVYGVVSYYSMFSLEPRGKYLIRVCKSPVCCIQGGLPILEELKQNLKININETTPDGLFTLEVAECLGKCDTAPSILINDKHYGGLTITRLNNLINQLRAENSD